MLTLWNPWKKARSLTETLDSRDREIAYLKRQLDLSADRYDKIRETNLALREALSLYRNNQ